MIEQQFKIGEKTEKWIDILLKVCKSSVNELEDKFNEELISCIDFSNYEKSVENGAYKSIITKSSALNSLNREIENTVERYIKKRTKTINDAIILYTKLEKKFDEWDKKEEDFFYIFDSPDFSYTYITDEGEKEEIKNEDEWLYINDPLYTIRKFKSDIKQFGYDPSFYFGKVVTDEHASGKETIEKFQFIFKCPPLLSDSVNYNELSSNSNININFNRSIENRKPIIVIDSDSYKKETYLKTEKEEEEEESSILNNDNIDNHLYINETNTEVTDMDIVTEDDSLNNNLNDLSIYSNSNDNYTNLDLLFMPQNEEEEEESTNSDNDSESSSHIENELIDYINNSNENLDELIKSKIIPFLSQKQEESNLAENEEDQQPIIDIDNYDSDNIVDQFVSILSQPKKQHNEKSQEEEEEQSKYIDENEKEEEEDSFPLEKQQEQQKCRICKKVKKINRFNIKKNHSHLKICKRCSKKKEEKKSKAEKRLKSIKKMEKLKKNKKVNLKLFDSDEDEPITRGRPRKQIPGFIWQKCVSRNTFYICEECGLINIYERYVEHHRGLCQYKI